MLFCWLLFCSTSLIVASDCHIYERFILQPLNQKGFPLSLFLFLKYFCRRIFFLVVFVIDYNSCVFFLLLLGTNESFLEARNLSPSSRSVGTFNLKNFCTKLCSQLGAYELFCYFWSLPQKMNWWFYHERTATYMY